MSIGLKEIIIGDVPFVVTRKAIRNLHLRIYPPDGQVRITAPWRMSDDAIRLAVTGKLGWIQGHRARLRALPQRSPLQMIDGEVHYFLGQPYRLRIVEVDGSLKVVLRDDPVLELYVRPSSTIEERAQVLQWWYRQQLKSMVPLLIEKWQTALGVSVAEWGIKQMKTRWGTCNIRARRIWLNLELIKKPAHCLELIVVHELAHLLERRHNARFKSIMDQHLPNWRTHRADLAFLPLVNDRISS